MSEPRESVKFLAVTAVYTVVAVLNLKLGRPSPIWIPAGLAVFFLLVGGKRYWAAIAAGIFFSAWASGTFETWVGIVRTPLVMAGNLAEAAGIVWMVQRWADGRPFSTTKANMLYYLFALVGCLISALVGTVSAAVLVGFGFEVWWERFYTWLMGDFIGVIIVVPLLLSLWRRGQRQWWLVPLVALAVGGSTWLILQVAGLEFIWLSFFAISAGVYLDDVRGAAVGIATQFVLVEELLIADAADVLFIQLYILGIGVLIMLAASSRLELQQQNGLLNQAVARFEERLRDLHQGE